MRKIRVLQHAIKIAFYSVFCMLPVSAQQISPMLVGQNVWNNPNDYIWHMVTECGVQSIRIGGIEYDNNMPSNSTLLDWVKKIKAMGAEPIMQVPRFWAPPDAAALVNFFNKQNDGVRITYWQIGNEPDNNGFGNPVQDVGTVANYIRTIASAMKAEDPSIKIYPVSCSWFRSDYYPALVGGNLDICGKDAYGRWMIDGIDFHSYPNGNNYSREQVVNNSAAGIRKNVTDLVSMMAAADAKNGRTGDARLKWGLSEFNITWDNPGWNTAEANGVHSFLNGQFFAEVLGIGMANSATFTCTWSMHEADGNRGAGDLGFLDGSAMTPRSSYYHMQLVAKNFSGTYAAGTSNLPNIRAYGCKDTDKICVMILNMENTAQREFTVQLNTSPINSATESKININADCDKNYTGSISNQSTQLLIFTRDGLLSKKYTYSLSMYTVNQPPSLETFSTDVRRDKMSMQPQSARLAHAEITGNSLVVKLSQPKRFKVECISANGRVQVSASGFGSQCRFNAGKLPAGLYIVKITTEAGCMQSRVIVSR